ncbi:MAG: lysophospholipid acyltransferase family protein [Thermonemataceae bacterium]
MIFFTLISKLPFWCLYLVADVIYFLAYYVVGYRKKVVEENLRKAFPEKSAAERSVISKKFYRHLADVVVETLKIPNLSAAAIQQRITTKRLSLLKNHLDAGTSVIVLTSHQGNWEWLSLISSIGTGYPLDAVYQPLRNTFFDQLMLKIRQRFTIKAVKMKHTLRHVIAHRQEARIIALIADQSPIGSEKDYWTHFLHQETCFFTGGEKIARKLGYPVLFGGVVKTARGHYELYFEEIATPPYAHKQEGTITARYVKLLAQQIEYNPPYWLWSHKRWKRQRG